MAKITARTPKGMRDHLPADMIKRNYVINTIKSVFESFGFEPIDTPVLELKQTLLNSELGSEAEKLIYYAQHAGGKEELALRYDLTVPLSRFFAEHEHQLKLPFRRYHIAPVWRGERPQKGRYREFYQCDADIVGIKEITADAEVMSIVYTALRRLGFTDFSIKVNNRKLITGIGIYAGVPQEKLPDLYRLIDKTDKIGLNGVLDAMREEGFQEETIHRLADLLSLKGQGTLQQRLAALEDVRQILGDIAIAQEGIEELEALLQTADVLGIDSDHTELDFTMVRGLGYYTGPIFETVITKPDNLGSVQGGGRYDELIGRFRRQSLPTTGISLGIERIIDLMEMLNLYPESVHTTVVQVLVTAFDDTLQNESLRAAMELRHAGIRTEAYLEPRKSLGKQIGYADSKGIPVVVILGPDEVAQNLVQLKRLSDSHEMIVPRSGLVKAVEQLLNNEA
ncbi:MAG: histidine--tRNA ligase [Phototrophicales bacterium]|nr:MAG: histidine--tRNA ligase [Phototrophicales bacterium]